MSFKKQTLKKQPKIAGKIFGFLSIGFVVFLGIIVINNFELLKFDITNSDLTEEEINLTKEEIENIQDEEKKQEILEKLEKNKINILLTGRGGNLNDAPDLTDTIILASLDKHKKLISMLSIPRDLYVTYDSNENGKINGLFAKYYYKTESKNLGMEKLEAKLEEITGEKIDYYIDVDFAGFTKVIDALGGIEMTIPENFVDDQYPDNNWGYKTLVFRKGTWNFTGERALQYARSRHSTSDFDRSLRQQQVIEGIKRKVYEAEYLTSPRKLKEFYNIYKKYVATDIGITDFLDFYPVLKDINELKMLSYNVNDSCFYGATSCEKGGFLYLPERSYFNGMSVLLFDGTDVTQISNYDIAQRYSEIVFNRQEFFIESAQVNIFNSTRVPNLAGALSNDIIRYGFNIPQYNSIGNTPQVYEKSVIYYNNIDEDSETIKLLKTFFDGEFIKTETPQYSKDQNTQIEIVIGSDYTATNSEVFSF